MEEKPEKDLALEVAQELEFLARALSILESCGKLNETGRKILVAINAPCAMKRLHLRNKWP